MLWKCKVFKVIDCPKNQKVIWNQWVFDAKPDEWKKACLVVKGFSQVKRSDFDQIFLPVVCFETVQLMLGLAAFEDWYISGLDVKSIYLYGKLNEEIYMEQPEGFKFPDKKIRSCASDAHSTDWNRLD